jgi:hypothetical protein
MAPVFAILCTVAGFLNPIAATRAKQQGLALGGFHLKHPKNDDHIFKAMFPGIMKTLIRRHTRETALLKKPLARETPRRFRAEGDLGMRERLEMSGGTLAIDSGSGKGTSVRAIIPTDRGKPAEPGKKK